MTRDKKLKAIAFEIEQCLICRQGKSGKAVPGEGSSFAEIMFVGEAPGRNEAETGRPFIGRSGKLLRKAIVDIGLKENEVFITSPVKYLPDYKTPNEEDIQHGMIHLAKQIEIINPKILVLLGSVAVRGVLGEKLLMSKSHGKMIKRGNRTFFIAYHPAAAIRFVKFKTKFLEDFQALRNLI